MLLGPKKQSIRPGEVGIGNPFRVRHPFKKTFRLKQNGRSWKNQSPKNGSKCCLVPCPAAEISEFLLRAPRVQDQKRIMYGIKKKLSTPGSKTNYLQDQKQIISPGGAETLWFTSFSGNSVRILRLQLKNRHFQIQAQYAKVTLAAPVRKSQLFRYKRSSINEPSIG